MPHNPFDINVYNGVAIVVDSNVRPVKWRYTPDFVTNQNNWYMLKICLFYTW